MELKKIIYIICSTILGFLLALIALGLLEYWYINKTLAQGLVPKMNNAIGMQLFLPPLLEMGIFLVGVLGGFALGFYWWNLVYVKNHPRRWRF